MVMISAEDLNRIIDRLADMRYRQGVEDARASMKPMTLTDVAEYLQVNVSTINRWMNKGEIAYHRLGGKPYFLREDILAKMKKK